MPPKKVAIYGIDAQGHFQPTLSLATGLIQRGFRVDYITPSDITEPFERAGAQIRKIQSAVIDNSKKVPPQDGYQAEWLIDKVRNRVIEDAIQNLPVFMEYCEREKPDAVLFDKMCIAASIGASHFDIPSAMLHPTYCGNHLIRGAHPIFDAPRNPDTILRIDQQISTLNAISCEAPSSIEELLGDHSTCNIAFMSKAFHPVGEQLNDGYYFVGPQLAEIEFRPWSAKRLIYVSLGTIFGTGRNDLFWDCIHALSDIEYDVIVSVGSKNSADEFQNLPENVKLYQSVDQHDILSKAAVFVTHGGLNSVQEAIWHGVPMIVLPQGFDQFTSATRVADLGCGVNLEHSSDRIQDITRAVQTLANSCDVGENLKAQRRYAATAGGSDRVAAIVEGLCH